MPVLDERGITIVKPWELSKTTALTAAMMNTLVGKETLMLGVGTFTVPTAAGLIVANTGNTVAVPVNFVGVAPEVSIIKSALGPFIYAGADTTFTKLRLEGGGSVFSTIGTGTFTLRFEHCHLIADDNTINCGGSGTYVCEYVNCLITGNGNAIRPTAGTHRFFNCDIRSSGADYTTFAANRGVYLTTAGVTIDIYGGRIYVDQGGTSNVGVYASNGAVNLYGVDIQSAGSGTLADVQQASSGVIKIYGSAYDTQKTSGTLYDLMRREV